MSLSEAIAAGYHARRPWWQRFGQALAGQAPDTLRGRWTLEARAAVALACVALIGAAVGGWYYWQSQSTMVALPDASTSNVQSGGGSVALPAIGSGLAGAALPTVGGGAEPTLPPAPRGPNAVGQAGAPPASLASLAALASLPGVPTSTTALIIDVEGKVAHPGIVDLPPGSRVFEALNAAGGTIAGADATGLDLARPLVDGEQLRIGLPGAPSPPSGVANSPAPAPAPAPGPARGGRKTKPAQPVDLNTATLEQLQTIPSVGPAMAQRILDWRAEHGRFESVDQLREVKGIGDKKFATMKDSVTV